MRKIRLTQNQRNQGWVLSEECGFMPGSILKDAGSNATISVRRYGSGWGKSLIASGVGQGQPVKFKTLASALSD